MNVYEGTRPVSPSLRKIVRDGYNRTIPQPNSSLHVGLLRRINDGESIADSAWHTIKYLHEAGLVEIGLTEQGRSYFERHKAPPPAQEGGE